MDRKTQQVSLRRVLALAAGQHGVVTRAQLLALGLSSDAIEYRLRRGRLHQVGRGVYAVGRPQLTRHGTLIAAVLSCGAEAVLSHESAGELWGIRGRRLGPVEVTLPRSDRTRPGVRVHRRVIEPHERTRRHAIPVTSPVRTLVDLAHRLDPHALERAVNEADRLDLVDPDRLRTALEALGARRGVAGLRALLDRRTFTLTDSTSSAASFR
jgi:predicted transcriptional regulator of viral defense system